MERKTEMEPILKMRPRTGGNGRRNRNPRPPWDWKALTANPNVRMTNELVRKYIAKWDWSAMAWRSWEDYDAREFYSQFFERVPLNGFSGSKLEFALHQQEIERLWKEMNEQ